MKIIFFAKKKEFFNKNGIFVILFLQENNSLGEIGRHDRLKICSLNWGIGSNPIVSIYKTNN